MKISLNQVLTIVLFQNPFNMKTKLLKKVRRRYFITKINSLSLSEGEVLLAISNEFGFPFYIVGDNRSVLGLRDKYYKTYNECIESLLEMIVHDYSDAVGRTKTTSTKVWWK